MLNCCWGKIHPEYKKARSFPFNISVPMIHKEYLICNGCAATTITKIFPSLLLHPPIFVLVQDAFCVVTSDILTSLLLYFLDSLWSRCFEWLNQGISITFAWKAHVFESSHGGFLKRRSPIAGWLIIENPIPMDDLGVPLWLRKPSSNYHISLNNAVLVPKSWSTCRMTKVHGPFPREMHRSMLGIFVGNLWRIFFWHFRAHKMVTWITTSSPFQMMEGITS